MSSEIAVSKDGVEFSILVEKRGGLSRGFQHRGVSFNAYLHQTVLRTEALSHELVDWSSFHNQLLKSAFGKSIANAVASQQGYDSLISNPSPYCWAIDSLLLEIDPDFHPGFSPSSLLELTRDIIEDTALKQKCYTRRDVMAIFSVVASNYRDSINRVLGVGAKYRDAAADRVQGRPLLPDYEPPRISANRVVGTGLVSFDLSASTVSFEKRKDRFSFMQLEIKASRLPTFTVKITPDEVPGLDMIMEEAIHRLERCMTNSDTKNT